MITILSMYTVTQWWQWSVNELVSYLFNSLAPGRSECDSKNVIFNLVLLIGIFRFSNTLRWMPQDLTDDKSTLAQVMAWCRQATSHYLSQCWLSSLSLYGVTRPQWVKWLCSTPDVTNPSMPDLMWSLLWMLMTWYLNPGISSILTLYQDKNQLTSIKSCMPIAHVRNI